MRARITMPMKPVNIPTTNKGCDRKHSIFLDLATVNRIMSDPMNPEL